MQIKIIKNKPLNELSSDITHLIDREFEVIKIDKEGHADIEYPEGNYFTIFKGEYEIVQEENN